MSHVDAWEQPESEPAQKQKALAIPRQLTLEPRGMDEAKELAKIATGTKFWGVENPQQAFMIIKQGQELGMTAVQSLNLIHLIRDKRDNIKPVMSAQGMVANVLSSGKADYLKCVEQTDKKAVWKTHRKDDPDPEPTVLEFTIDEAKQMGLTGKQNWQKQPKTMLKWRAAAAIAREVYPDVIAGIYTPDEISEGAIAEVSVSPVEHIDKVKEELQKKVDDIIDADFEESSKDPVSMTLDELRTAYKKYKKQLGEVEVADACEGVIPKDESTARWCIQKIQEYCELLDNK